MHERSPLRRILSGMGSLALAVGAVVSVAVAWTVVTRGILVAPVLSPSMRPSFTAGDLLVTRRQPIRSIQVGQVVRLPLPDTPGQTYVHRVIGVERRAGAIVVRTKGDANPEADARPVGLRAGHVPLVIASVPYAGRLGTVAGHTGLRVTLIAGVAACALVAAKRLLFDSWRPAPRP